MKVLREFLGANKPTIRSDLCDVFRAMVETAGPNNEKLKVLGRSKDMQVLTRWMERSLHTTESSVPIGTRDDNAIEHGRRLTPC